VFVRLVAVSDHEQQTLKDYIDETSRGLYNFLYLRIGMLINH
jgi:hypothetical protein